MTLIRPRLDAAECRGREDIFLQSRPNPDALNTMRAICAGCWDRPECLAYALEHEESGFWAGHTAKQRTELREKYGIKVQPILIGTWVGDTYQPSGGTNGEDQAADAE